MTKTSTAMAIAGGTIVTVCVAGGSVIGLARAFDAPQVATTTLTTSHGVTTKSADRDPFTKTKTTTDPTPAPVTDAPLSAPAPMVVPPAAPRMLTVPVPSVTDKAKSWNGDAHRWMHHHNRSDFDKRAASSDPAPRMAPAPKMAPMQSASEQQSDPAPRHRAEPPSNQWGKNDGRHDGGSRDGGSHDWGHSGGYDGGGRH